MGLFDGIAKAFSGALANEDLPPPPNEGFSQDSWLGGVRKSIIVQFVKGGQLIGQAECLPGEKISELAARAGVDISTEAVALSANDVRVRVTAATARIPAPTRSNVIAQDLLGEDAAQLMDSGFTAPFLTSFSSRGEVRVLTKKDTIYVVDLE